MKTYQYAHPSGAISLGCLGYIISIGLLWGGSQGVYTALKNRKPLELTVAEYIAKKPNVEWVILKEARLSLIEAAYKETAGKITEVFIPVRPRDGGLNEPVHILLSTESEEMIGAIYRLKNAQGNEAETLKVEASHSIKLLMFKDVKGLIKFGIDDDSRTRGRLGKLDVKFADGFVILEEGKQPDIFEGGFMLGAGLLIGFLMLRKAAKPSPAAAPISPPNLPPKL